MKEGYIVPKMYSDGSVFQTKSGEWRGKITLTDPATKKKLPTKYFYHGKSAADIRRKINEYRNDPLNFSGAAVSKADASRYFRKWLDEYKKPDIKVSSYDRLDETLRLYIEPEFEHYQLGEITADMCKGMITKYKDKGLSFSTVKKIYDALNACFTFAEARHDVYESPMRTVTMIPKVKFDTKRKNSDEARNLTDDEETAFLAEIDRKTAATNRYVYRYRDAFILDLNTGMRLGELVALDWSDVDFENRSVFVYKTAVMVNDRYADGSKKSGVHQVIQESPKKAKSRRHIPLNDAAFDAIVRLKAQAGDNAFVFPTQTGARVVMSSLEKQYSNIAGHCEIEGTSFHSLRHTFATRLFERGAEVKKVSELLGHATVAVTYNTYIHVIKESKADVVKLLDRGA